MKTVAYCNPLVPPEWIAAHGFGPQWLQVRPTAGRALAGIGRGVCPYAAAMMDTVSCGVEAAAVVLTTTCDQMRYAAAMLEHTSPLPVFLMNVPSMWQTAAAGRLYLEELHRLGRFLVRLGGRTPTDEHLAAVMLQHDRARAAVSAARARLSARQFATGVAEVRGAAVGQAFQPDSAQSEVRPSSRPCAERTAVRLESLTYESLTYDGIPLAIVGGPLLERDFAILDLIEQSGGRVVLDATEGGERTLPAAFDAQRVREAPLQELANAYFGAIPDPFRRPNDALYDWLGRELAARQVRGMIFRRYVSCDLWHAELHRLKQWSPLPVLDIDVDHDDESALGRTTGRIEAFLEMLKAREESSIKAPVPVFSQGAP